MEVSKQLEVIKRVVGKRRDYYIPFIVVEGDNKDTVELINENLELLNVRQDSTE